MRVCVVVGLLLIATVRASAQPVLEVRDAVVTEPAAPGGSAAASFVVVMSPPANISVTLVFRTVDRSATEGSDYVGATPFRSVIIPPQSVGFSIPIPVIGDTIAEGPEFFELEVLDVTRGVTLVRPFAFGTILDPGGAPCTYSLNLQAVAFDASGGLGGVDVATQAGCPWRAETDASFVSIRTPAGAGSGPMQFDVAPNVDPAARSATIQVAGLELQVTQEAFVPPVPVRRFLVPHLEATLETPRRGVRASETLLHFVNTAPVMTGDTVAKVWLFDEGGSPLESATGADVCNPCIQPLGNAGETGPFKFIFSTRGAIAAAGGIPATGIVGSALLEIEGADQEFVAATGSVTRSGESREYVPVVATPGASGAKTLTLPHVFETKGGTTSPVTFDFTLTATNASGMGGVGAGGDSVLQIFLFDAATGNPLEGQTGAICPSGCAFVLQPGRKLRKSVEDLANERAGGLKGVGPLNATLGYAIVTVTGAGADATNMFTFITNAHTSAFDLSVIGFAPEEIRAPSQ